MMGLLLVLFFYSFLHLRRFFFNLPRDLQKYLIEINFRLELRFAISII